MLLVLRDPPQHVVSDVRDELSCSSADHRACAVPGLRPIRITGRELVGILDLCWIAMRRFDPSKRVIRLDDIDRVPVGEIRNESGTKAEQPGSLFHLLQSL